MTTEERKSALIQQINALTHRQLVRLGKIARAVTALDLAETYPAAKSTLDRMYAAMRQTDKGAFSGLVECVPVGSITDLWLDEEANLSSGRKVWMLGDHYFSGPGLILSHDGEGETVGTNVPLWIVAPHIAFTNLETSGEFGESREEALPGGGFIFHGGAPVYQESTP